MSPVALVTAAAAGKTGKLATNITGTVAVTQANQTSSASGTVGTIPQFVQRVRGTGTTSISGTLPAAPTAGNMLIICLRVNTGALSTITNPSGWTVLADNDDATVSWRLFGKVSAGTEQTVAITLTGATNGRYEYEEWANMAGVATVYDATNSIEAGRATRTTWNPASITPDQNRVVAFCYLGFNADPGTFTTNWVGADATFGGSTFTETVGYHIITTGAAFDTTVTWTNSIACNGLVGILRGA